MSEKKQKHILLTGSTGNFGPFLAKEFLNHQDVHLYLLVRASSDNEAQQRVAEFISTDPEKITILRSDLTKDNLDLTESVYRGLSSKITHILHSAATTRFNLPLEESRVSNVVTTENVLKLAKNCPNLIRFGFLSSVYTAGKRSGLIKEDEFEHTAGFSNSYQQTKYEAESLVRAEKSELPVVVFRSPFIVSPELPKTKKGKKNFLSTLISFIAKGYLPIVPGTAESVLDIVNSHDAAKAIVDIFLKDQISYATYHISNGRDALNIGILHHTIEEKMGRKIPIEYCGSLDSFQKKLDEVSVHKPELKELYRRAESFLLEPAFSKTFDNSNTLTELGINHLGQNPLEILELMFQESWNLSE